MTYKEKICAEIKAQLIAGSNRKFICMSWGIREFKGGEDRTLGYNAPYLTFTVSGQLFKGQVKIILNSLDYYTILFLDIKGNEKMPRLENIDCEQITEAIDKKVENPKGTFKY